MVGFGFSHPTIVKISGSAITSFYRKIEVYGYDNVPEEGPVIFACTHTNMAIDPAVLSNTIPHGHYLHYWVKDSLFKNPFMKQLLTNAGNIPVDRKNKNNQSLFRGTFDALAANECVGIFPEGTSHTLPHLIPLKDGVSWTALEYLVYLRGSEESGEPHEGKPAVIVPVAIQYCDKSKYRSRLCVTYASPITMDAYAQMFLSNVEGENKLAVKGLTAELSLALFKMTVNAPDWDVSYAAEMARELLWRKEDDLALADFVDVGQTLTDLFATRGNTRIDELRSLLATYRRLLTASRLSNAALTDIPLPKSLDPSADVPLPGRLRTLLLLVKDTIVCLIQFPLFFIPFLFNIPIYAVGIFGAGLAEDEEETRAQMKVFLGVFLSFLTYPIGFFIFLWMFRQVPLSMALSAGAVWLLGKYHAALIDQNYNGFKRLVAAWRVLVGVWLGPSVEMSLNTFVDQIASFAPHPPKRAGLPPNTPKEEYVRPKHLPSRVLVRHVLRMRIQAARELAATLLELEDTDARVKASYWLAERYGGDVLPVNHSANVAEYESEWPQGERDAREVMAFLRGRGARVSAQAIGTEEHWAASSAADANATAKEQLKAE